MSFYKYRARGNMSTVNTPDQRGVSCYVDRPNPLWIQRSSRMDERVHEEMVSAQMPRPISAPRVHEIPVDSDESDEVAESTDDDNETDLEPEIDARTAEEQYADVTSALARIDSLLERISSHSDDIKAAIECIRTTPDSRIQRDALSELKKSVDEMWSHCMCARVAECCLQV